MKILGGQTSFCPPPNNFDNLKYVMQKYSTDRHYKTIKLNTKILLNIHNFQFCGALCAQSFILRLCTQSTQKNLKFSLLLPPPPPPIRKMDQRPCIIVNLTQEVKKEVFIFNFILLLLNSSLQLWYLLNMNYVFPKGN